MPNFEEYCKKTYPNGVLPGQPGALQNAFKKMLKDAYGQGVKDQQTKKG